MKPAKEIIPDLILVLLGSLILGGLFFFYKQEANTEIPWLIRIITALATAAMSIALPGFINIGNGVNATQRVSPNVKAGGALAVFVIVYLFNPIN